jgi:hypothetical protein
VHARCPAGTTKRASGPRELFRVATKNCVTLQVKFRGRHRKFGQYPGNVFTEAAQKWFQCAGDVLRVAIKNVRQFSRIVYRLENKM